MRKELTHERVKELLALDPSTHRFTWKVQRQCVRAGSEAGSLKPNGYRVVVVDGRPYLEHRLIWLYVHGKWPSHHLDHINTVKSDNRLENLREVTHKENMQNQPKARRITRTGFAGVRPHGKKFQACVCIWGTRKALGTFDTPEQAYAACMKAKHAAGIPTEGYKEVQPCA